MQLRTRASRSAQLIWLWALLPLLLAAGLIIPKMADDAFQFGEVASLRVAGALDSGPWSLANVWSSVAEISSEQALGWPMLLSVWGHSVRLERVNSSCNAFLRRHANDRLGFPYWP